MTPIDGSKQFYEKVVFFKLQDKRRKQKPKLRLIDMVRTSDIRSVFSKTDSTNYSYELYAITEIIHHTTFKYRVNYLPERHNENLLRSTNLTLDENNQIVKKLNLIQ